LQFWLHFSAHAVGGFIGMCICTRHTGEPSAAQSDAAPGGHARPPVAARAATILTPITCVIAGGWSGRTWMTWCGFARDTIKLRMMAFCG